MFNWKSINGFGGLAGGVGVETVKGWLGEINNRKGLYWHEGNG